VIMKKLEVPDVREQLEAIYKQVDKKIGEHGELTNEEINKIIHDYRSSKRC